MYTCTSYFEISQDKQHISMSLNAPFITQAIYPGHYLGQENFYETFACQTCAKDEYQPIAMYRTHAFSIFYHHTYLILHLPLHNQQDCST